MKYDEHCEQNNNNKNLENVIPNQAKVKSP